MVAGPAATRLVPQGMVFESPGFRRKRPPRREGGSASELCVPSWLVSPLPASN
jgi:hypothetical protein